MALLECPMCGAAQPPEARTCPACGRPRYLARLRDSVAFVFVKLALATALVVWLLWQVGWLRAGPR